MVNANSPVHQLSHIQGLQNRLSAALEAHCYTDENALVKLSMDIEHQLFELQDSLIQELRARIEADC